MIKIFTPEECLDIIQNGVTQNYIERCKKTVVDYLTSINVVLKNEKSLSHLISTIATPQAYEWHIDDVCLLNFIVCIDGIYKDEENNEDIYQLKAGYGKILIGELGYAFMGVKPTIHKAPIMDDRKRLMVKIFLDGSFDILNVIEGSSVAEYNSELFKERMKSLG